MRNRRSTLNLAASAAIEQLETRRMLSAVINASKQLVVTGTTGNDGISLTYATNRVTVRDNGTATKFLTSLFTGITINTAAGNDTITIAGNMPTTILSITIDSGSGNDFIGGSNLGEKITCGDGNDTANGTGGDDAIFGQGGADSLSGGDGVSDRIYPGLGDDTVSGGAGNYDTVTYQDRTDGVTARLDGAGFCGNLTSGEEDTVATDFENAVGGAGNDLVLGNAGINVVGGAKGDDTLDGGLGRDSIWGDEGVDTVTYASRTARLALTLDNVPNDGESGELDNIISMENAIGGSNSDFIQGNDSANSLLGGAGNDVIDGGAGNDTLEGGNGRDNITGGAGTNRIRGGAHNDTIIGGPHRDVIYADAGADSILAGKGNDFISGGTDADTIDGGLGDDSAVDDDLDVVTNVESLT